MVSALEARKQWSSIVTDAGNHKPTLIIRNSKPSALVVGYQDWQMFQWFLAASEVRDEGR